MASNPAGEVTSGQPQDRSTIGAANSQRAALVWLVAHLFRTAREQATPVKVSPFSVFIQVWVRAMSWTLTAEYWVRVKAEGRFIHVLGFSAMPLMGWLAWCAIHLGVPSDYLMRFSDESRGVFRVAHLDEGKLISAALIVPGHRPPAIASLEEWFKTTSAPKRNRRMLLALGETERAEARVSL
jgi:hypothetical protein